MTDSTVFEGTTNAQPAAQQTPVEANAFTTLVGETQKYKTPEDLAKAYMNADSFIETLKEENRKLREQAASAKTLDDVLERIQTSTAPQVDTPVVSDAAKPEDVQRLVKETLEQERAAERQRANLMAADKALREKFGDKAQEVFNSLASTPELKQSLMQVASIAPDKFVAMFAGVQVAEPQTTSVDMGSQTTAIVTNNGNRAAQEGTKEWASKIRKENPQLYWSQEFQSKLSTIVAKNPSLYFGN